MMASSRGVLQGLILPLIVLSHTNCSPGSCPSGTYEMEWGWATSCDLCDQSSAVFKTVNWTVTNGSGTTFSRPLTMCRIRFCALLLSVCLILVRVCFRSETRFSETRFSKYATKRGMWVSSNQWSPGRHDGRSGGFARALTLLIVLASATATSTSAPTPTSTCASTCFGETCEHWVGLGYTCEELETTTWSNGTGSMTNYACDCSGCSCNITHEFDDEFAGSCPNGCFGQMCDFWVESGYTCSEMESAYGCDCAGCSCTADDDNGIKKTNWTDTCEYLYFGDNRVEVKGERNCLKKKYEKPDECIAAVKVKCPDASIVHMEWQSALRVSCRSFVRPVVLPADARCTTRTDRRKRATKQIEPALLVRAPRTARRGERWRRSLLNDGFDVWVMSARPNGVPSVVAHSH